MKYPALVACLIFVGWLLKKDQEASPRFSKAFWVPMVWFLYCTTRPLVEWFQPGSIFTATDAGGVESGSMLDRNFNILLSIAGLIILQKRRINWAQTIKNNGWLFVLFVYMLVSILWSDFPFISFKRWFRTAGPVIMALVILSEASPCEAMHAILRRTVYIVIPFSVLLVKYFPQLGVQFGRWSGEPMYAGATINKNTLGEVCAIALFLTVWTFIAKRDGKIVGPIGSQRGLTAVFLFLIFYLMKGPSGYGAVGANYSATSIAVLFIALGVFLTLLRFKAHLAHLGRWLAFGLVGCGVVVLAMKMVDISPMSIVAQVLGRDPTLTGRKDLIWDVLLPMALQHPAVGQGYGSFWIRPVPGLILDINEAHNGYLDVFIELGGVGLILLIPVLVAYFRKARNEMERDFNWAAFRISFLVMFLLHNCTETTWLRSREILWNLFVFFFVVFPKEWTGCHLEENVSADEVPAQVGAAPAVSPVGVTDSVLDHGMVDAEQGLHKC